MKYKCYKSYKLSLLFRTSELANSSLHMRKNQKIYIDIAKAKVQSGNISFNSQNNF